MLEYVYGTEERIFVNTVIGCHAKCSYCYLPSLLDGQKDNQMRASEVIARVNNMPEFKPGKNHTIISLGCYSECLFPRNIDNTLEVIEYFCKTNNYIQLATKQKIDENICKQFTLFKKYQNQINVYISMPTISSVAEIEQGTASIRERISSIQICKQYGINVILYIKPFLGKLTAVDINKYIDLVRQYDIPIVVGGYLSNKATDVIAQVGENMLYEECISEEMMDFIAKLSRYTKVYFHSTDVIEQMREKEKEDGATKQSNCDSVK